MIDSTRTKLIPDGSIIARRYEVIKNLGVGGMGAVYLVVDHQEGNAQRAMKVLHPHISTDKSYVSRFIREMELMEKINHPNVVKVYDFGTFESIIFFTMEYVDFPTLEYLIDHGEFESKLIPYLIVGVADALEAIHSLDIIHRDLKPGNILISKEGRVKITDFGVARPMVSEMELTMQNQKVGSVAYMAPEVWLSKDLSPAVDYYSLGVVLYEVVTGELPFPDTDDLIELMKMHTKGSITAPSKKRPELPAWLNEITLNLLNKNPKNRMKLSLKSIAAIRERFPHENLDYLSPYDTDHLGLVPSNTKERELTKLVGLGSTSNKSKRRATVVMQVTATQNRDTEVLDIGSRKTKRRATVIIPLPKNAAVVFEFEAPSTDFICFGVFLASLQVFDGYLTAEGMQRFGVMMEGNVILRYFMEHWGVHGALLIAKLFAIVVVGLMTIVAKHVKWIQNVILALSLIYLTAAIIPWIYILYWRAA